jgi:hypothetical protein
VLSISTVASTETIATALPRDDCDEPEGNRRVPHVKRPVLEPVRSDPGSETRASRGRVISLELIASVVDPVT